LVPDPKLSTAENHRVSAELAALSSKLYWLLPDPSLSPFERLERLGRVVEERTPDFEQLQSASVKLRYLRKRIDELVPGDLTPERKIDLLLEKLDTMVGVSEKAFAPIQKLELLGDPRGKISPE
jgi:hypothetical protein